MINEFKQVLMSRDNLTEEEAELEVNECKQRVMNGEDPEEILYDYGLEPDYIFDIMPY